MQLELTPQSRDDFAAFTGRHVGETIDLSVDGEVLMSPRLMEPIAGGMIMVSGSFAQGELEKIATISRRGPRWRPRAGIRRGRGAKREHPSTSGRA